MISCQKKTYPKTLMNKGSMMEITAGIVFIMSVNHREIAILHLFCTHLAFFQCHVM